MRTSTLLLLAVIASSTCTISAALHCPTVSKQESQIETSLSIARHKVKRLRFMVHIRFEDNRSVAAV